MLTNNQLKNGGNNFWKRQLKKGQKTILSNCQCLLSKLHSSMNGTEKAHKDQVSVSRSVQHVYYLHSKDLLVSASRLK